MTRQEIYDKVKNHLLAQGQRSVAPADEFGIAQCLYRGPEGRKCAAGVLIAGEHYSPTLEGKAVFKYPCVDEALVKSGVSHSDLSFVGKLQEIHDDDYPSDWESQLAALARQYGLQP